MFILDASFNSHVWFFRKVNCIKYKFIRFYARVKNIKNNNKKVSKENAINISLIINLLLVE